MYQPVTTPEGTTNALPMRQGPDGLRRGVIEDGRAADGREPGEKQS